MTAKKILIMLLIISFLNFVGCYSMQTATKTDIDLGNVEVDYRKEIFINTKDRSNYHFLAGNYKIVNDTLFGQYPGKEELDKNPTIISIPYNDIVSINQEDIDTIGTAGASLGIVAIIAVVAGLAILIIGFSNLGEKFNSD